MTEQLALAIDTAQPTWRAPDVRGACGRDPAAGPGSCAYWWEGCPKAEARGCFRLWAKSEVTQAYWLERAPAVWTAAPEELAPLTAGRLADRWLIEVREPEGERWQWRRKPARAGAK